MNTATAKYLRKPALVKRLPIGVATLDRWVSAGLFPKPVKLGPRAVAWLESEVAAWEAERAEARDLPNGDNRAA